MYDAGEESDGLPGTYEIYKAEADALFKNGDYRKAIESYTTALLLRPDDRISLVCRSKCHLMLGDTAKSLRDAEASLAENKNYHKGMFQKAEALYYEGDFEMALVFYHRGHRLRPELQDFRLGIQKAQEAIQNSVGTPDRVKLDTSGDLSFFTKLDEKKTKRKGVVAAQRPQTVPKRKRPAERSAQNEKTIRQMLGELYGDKQYLEKILKETDAHSVTGKRINSLAEEGLCYLDTRTEFWQQVKPMYARKYESRMALNRGKVAKTSPHEYIMRELEKIDQLMSDENYQATLKRAKRLMNVLEGYNETQLGNKMTFKANIHSVQGNAYLEINDYENATKQHQMDLNIGEEFGIEDAESRGLDNLGRVCARKGEFDKAIELWERKLPHSKTALETTWLCHELGRCYLELQQWRTAKDYGERSLAAAEEVEDDGWQLHALVLISQAEAKSGRLSSSLVNFERALELANLSQDTAAQEAITKAMDDLNTKIAKREQEGGEEPDEGHIPASDASAAQNSDEKEKEKEEQPPTEAKDPSPRAKDDKKSKKEPTPQPSPRVEKPKPQEQQQQQQQQAPKKDEQPAKEQEQQQKEEEETPVGDKSKETIKSSEKAEVTPDETGETLLADSTRPEEGQEDPGWSTQAQTSKEKATEDDQRDIFD